MLLAIDTSTRSGAVGLWDGATFIRAAAWLSLHSHTAELLPAVQSLLAATGARMEDVSGIAVAQGPGGFSVLRAGFGVAKGLALARGLPVAGVSTLEASAYPLRHAGLPLCAVVESGRDMAGWARFQQTPRGWKRRGPDKVTPVDDLVASTRRHTLFCGDVTGALGERLLAALGTRAHFAPAPAPLLRLQGVAELGGARLAAGDADALAGLQPRYLRPPGITPPAPARRIARGGAPGTALHAPLLVPANGQGTQGGLPARGRGPGSRPGGMVG